MPITQKVMKSHVNYAKHARVTQVHVLGHLFMDVTNRLNAETLNHAMLQWLEFYK